MTIYKILFLSTLLISAYAQAQENTVIAGASQALNTGINATVDSAEMQVESASEEKVDSTLDKVEDDLEDAVKDIEEKL